MNLLNGEHINAKITITAALGITSLATSVYFTYLKGRIVEIDELITLAKNGCGNDLTFNTDTFKGVTLDIIKK